MPPRNSMADKIVIAASKCLRFACERNFNITHLGALAQIVSGGTPSTDNISYWDGDFVWITPKDLGKPRDIEITDSERHITQEGLKNSSAKLLPIGTVLLSSRAPIGHIGITSVPACTNQGFKNIICSNLLNNRYLFHMLRANIEELTSLGRGNTFKEIPAKVVEEFAIPVPPIEIQYSIAQFLDCVYMRSNNHQTDLPLLPPTLSEQQRVVGRIEELAAKIEKAWGVRRASATEVERLFGTTVSDLFSKGSEQGWTTGRLEDYIIDDCYGTSEKTTDDKSGIPILRMGNIQDGRLDLHDLKYLHLSSEERGKFLLIRGDIVVNRTNSAELVGKCAVFDVEGDYGFASYLIRLRFDTNKADPRLISIYINSPVGRAYMFNERTQMTGQANVNAKKLKSLPIALPALPEQRHIVAYLDNLQSRLDTLKRIQVKTSTELDAMLPSIFDKAFKGEL